MAGDIKLPDFISGWRQTSALKVFSAVLLDTFMATASTFGAQWGPFAMAWFYQLGNLSPGWRMVTSAFMGFFLAMPIASGVMWRQWVANRNQLDKDLKAAAVLLGTVVTVEGEKRPS